MYISKHQIWDTVVIDWSWLESSEKWLAIIIWIVTSLSTVNENGVSYHYSLVRTWNVYQRTWTCVHTVTEVLNNRTTFIDIITEINLELSKVNRDIEIYLADYNKKIEALQVKQTLVDTYVPLFAEPQPETPTDTQVDGEAQVNNEDDEDDD